MSELADKFFQQALDAVKARDYDKAAAILVEVIKLKPDYTEAWIVRGNILRLHERSFDALLHYDRALEINDNLYDAWNNRGVAFSDLGLWQAAEDSFYKSLEIMPAPEPHMGLADMYCTTMRLEDAQREYQAAIDAWPTPQAQFNRGITLLGLGRWQEGYKQYEARWLDTAYPPRPYRDYVKWHGEDLKGKTLIFYSEQGYGDEIMGLRFADRSLFDLGAERIILLARAPMFRLAQMLPDVSVMPLNQDKLPEADYSCPLLDVPMAAGYSWPEVSAPRPYLCAPDRSKVQEFRGRLGPWPDLKVGLCWSSGDHLGATKTVQLTKSVKPEWLLPLARPGVRLFSLQKPSTPAPQGLGLVDWMDECHDFADTAALIECLDLVISVDTSVAHLAGALGKPVWNLVRFSGYWPWLAPGVVGNSEKSIWYPTMRLFRQPALNNWIEPIQRISGELTKLTMGKAA